MNKSSDWFSKRMGYQFAVGNPLSRKVAVYLILCHLKYHWTWHAYILHHLVNLSKKINLHSPLDLSMVQWSTCHLSLSPPLEGLFWSPLPQSLPAGQVLGELSLLCNVSSQPVNHEETPNFNDTLGQKYYELTLRWASVSHVIIRSMRWPPK